MNKNSLYKEKAEAKLDEWSAEIDKMKAKLREEGADAGIDLQNRFEKFQSTVKSGWDELKSKFESEKREAVHSN